MQHRDPPAGVISFGNGSRVLECTIHNSSASWAELRADELGRELIKSEATATGWLALGAGSLGLVADTVTSAKPPIADESLHRRER
jgi:hypothetical protein